MTTGLRWRCDVCKAVIVGDCGYVGATYESIRGFEPVEWVVAHDGCRPDDDTYSLDVVKLGTPAWADWWTSHLSGKNWYGRAGWRHLLQARVGYLPPRSADTIDADQPGPWPMASSS